MSNPAEHIERYYAALHTAINAQLLDAACFGGVTTQRFATVAMAEAVAMRNSGLKITGTTLVSDVEIREQDEHRMVVLATIDRRGCKVINRDMRTLPSLDVVSVYEFAFELDAQTGAVLVDDKRLIITR